MDWIPKTTKLTQQIAAEKAKADLEYELSQWQLQSLQPSPINWQAPEVPQEVPQWMSPPSNTLTSNTLPYMEPSPVMQEFTPRRVVSPIAETPQIVEQTAPPKEKELKVPFWQRALQVFSAPFEWVDEYAIKPALALGATSIGAVKDVQRLPGEDFFEWKKRSWGSWEAPGIDIKVPWGDGDVRVDIKGVMEFAPWLLLPGAGQVGTAARAGIGVAGTLGKMGKVGRALGTAVELSPWGMAEKVTGAAMKSAVKGLSKVTSGAEAKVFGAISEKKVSPAVEEFTKFFDEQVIPLRKEFEKNLPRLRSRQEANTKDILSRARRGEITPTEAQDLMAKATAGGIKSEFAVSPWNRESVQKNIDELLGEVINATERGLVARDTATALHSLLLKGELPEPHHIREFSRVFGDKFAATVSQLKGVKRSKLDSIIDFLNIPRAVLAAGDISGVARHGLILGLVHPTKVPRSFTMMMKSMLSEKLALDIDATMRVKPLFREVMDNINPYLAPIEKGAVLTKVEESFPSAIAEKIPLVRRTERGFITYLNQLRYSVAESAYVSMKAMGASQDEMRMIGKFIDFATGRGDLPKALEKYAPVLNTIFFSPRLQAATLELPGQIGRMLMSKNPYMRKEAAKALVTFVGGGSALLMLLKHSGVAKVEIDPRSGDFGKLVIGDTRVDIWRGYAQYARFAAQLLTGQKKSAYGNMSKKERFDTAFRFLQSKSSPAFGLMVDLLKGESYMGDPLFEGTTGTIKTVRDRMMPLALQDVMDAMEQSGLNGLWTAAPATLGLGTLTYIDEFVKTKDKIAKTAGFETWDEIDPKTQREIWNRSPELQAAQIQFDRRVMETAWGEWRTAGNAIEDVFRQNVEQASEQFRVTKDGYKFRQRINDAFTARRGGYEARDKDPRFEEIVNRLNTQDTAEAMIALSPEQMAIRTYNDALYGDDMYDEFGEYRFDAAKDRKEQLKQVLGEELFNYVEEYQGIKYETFTPEFQEFKKAKEIMRPYWDVESEIVEMFGQRFAESNSGQRLISKLRKQKRAMNPELERYYQLFYAR